METAREAALRLYYETDARIQNKLPATTHKFADVARHAIARMETEIREGVGKQAYRDYVQTLNNWLITYFGGTDIAKLDLAAVTRFDAWRPQQSGKLPAQSIINNHNSALNSVLNLAELNGWPVKPLRPTLLNNGVKTQSRGSFSVEEYRVIYTALRSYHKQTTNEKSAATRETLRNYVLFLANTGVRHGTEALGLTWRNIEWCAGEGEGEGERYLAVSVDGKTNKRTAVARDRVVNSLWRQTQLNPRIEAMDFDTLIAAKSDEPVFTTRLCATVTVHNLNLAFNALLDELNLKAGANGRTRALYNWRHFYATQDLARGVSTHALSRQLGNNTEMIDVVSANTSHCLMLNCTVGGSRNIDETPVIQNCTV